MKSTHPKKIYLEITTRCNLYCRMCVKYAAGSCIPERDMPLDVFKQLLDSFPKAESLILNGIGEPLLHPHLCEFIKLARSRMVEKASIGFQSNGVLLDDHNALNLLEAGLDTLCLSVDGLESSEADCDSHKEHSFSTVAKAVSSLSRARQRIGSGFKIGLETVLTRKNIHQLPELVAWAAAQGVDYIITTNLILYSKATEKLNLFNPNSLEAVRLFGRYNQKAIAQGLNLEECIRSYRRFAGTRSGSVALDLIANMQKKAKEKDIRLNLFGLLEHDHFNADDTEVLLLKSRSIAENHGVDLFIPPLQAFDQRACQFITDKVTFITPNGDVMPCHFLWHTYSCRVLREDIQVQERVFGNVLQNSLETIWQSREYEEFRSEAGQYEYSSCWSCSQGPCANLVNDAGTYANDCFGSQVPCGHCQWNLGGIRCL
jgi:putative metalloenzyme radical SAM/SPASM domain maturase